jgi:hypothetical protein
MSVICISVVVVVVVFLVVVLVFIRFLDRNRATVQPMINLEILLGNDENCFEYVVFTYGFICLILSVLIIKVFNTLDLKNLFDFICDPFPYNHACNWVKRNFRRSA